ncbi:hypothetical protein OZX74_05945 [Bifidobacterium sp. ESL0798]|uniref:lanthionine synthetase LanC family protein n=1 Tax=Bifidobacterium sp. ESL0798 TaxID=2983235 RepID=UPI0023F96C67|nr:lanthionine synthetase LanC family protein [Bifidobacterium sp. ESL0798]WEV73478.1 hypothetical protein OZX74_05945 [Bifidobacterium sp. ESL0798]
MTSEINKEIYIQLIEDSMQKQQDMEASKNYHPLNIDCGEIAYCLTLAVLDHLYPDEGWDYRAAPYINKVIQAYRQNPFVYPGLFSGQALVCWCLRSLAHNGTRYQTAIHQVDERLRKLTTEIICQFDVLDVAPSQIYDIISGLSGALFYCLHYMNDDDLLQDTAKTIYTSLSRRFMKLGVDGFGSLSAAVSHQRETAADKVTDLGFAHGLLGVIGILNLANSKLDINDPILKYKCDTELCRLLTRAKSCGNILPYASPRESLKSSFKNTSMFDDSDGRYAWCYGNGGLAVVNNLLPDSSFQKPISILINQPLQDNYKSLTDNDYICHGWAGIYLSCHQFLSEDNLKKVQAQIICRARSKKPTQQYGFLDGELGLVATVLCIRENNIPDPLFPFTGLPKA